MNATTGNSSVVSVWNQTTTSFDNFVTTENYGDSNKSTLPIWTTSGPEIEFELKWIEPLAIIMDGFFVMLALIFVAFFVFVKLAASARLRWGRRFEVAMRVGGVRLEGERPAGINERNVALRNLV